MRKPAAPPEPPAFAVKVGMLRVSKGWSQGKLADELGVKRSTFADYVGGKTAPEEMPAGVMVRLAHLSRESVEYWLNERIRTYPSPAVVSERLAEMQRLSRGADVPTLELARGILADPRRAERVRKIEDLSAEPRPASPEERGPE